MLERAADGLYTVNLGNLMPGEAAVVRYRYAQLLAFEQGRVRLAVPTVIAPRYGDAGAAQLQAHQAPITALDAAYPFEISIVLNGAIGAGRVASPSHQISSRLKNGQLEIGLAQKAWIDRDFVLSIEDLAGQSLSVAGKDGDGAVVLASFCPFNDAPAIHAPLALKILLDCSGSMAGDSIASAKRAMHEILKHLAPDDLFSYSCFGDSVVHCTSSLVAATGRAIRHAAHCVGVSEADLGGTEMGRALAAVYALSQGTSADILLITDGEVWNVDALIGDALRMGQRVFAVGIGSAPADGLLRSIASKTGGACECIGANDDVQAAILRMFKRMRQAPVRELSVAWDAPANWQARPPPALFYGETAHVFATFVGSPPLTATMNWRPADDDAAAQALQIPIDAALADGDTLARMAAAMRLAEVDKAERDALALKYQLVTDCTNLLITHRRNPDDKAASAPELRMVAQMAAAGWGGVGTAARSFNSMKAPAVWRRESASEAVRAGMDRDDIPFFLRRQNDVVETFPDREGLIDFLKSCASGSNLALNGGRALPASLTHLAGEIPSAIFDALLSLREDGYPDAEIVIAFLAALLPLASEAGLPKRFVQHLELLAGEVGTRSQLHERIDRVLASAMRKSQHVELRKPARLRRFSWRGFFSFISKSCD